ncbi:hypothetical protein WMO13_06505 [Ignatzschineria larvae DSM 13226]|uniref:DUF4177 domain-containing protein n=1 Tax=Ignatzschineria larvae DSM 13226 TaxID=1111732 RepID=A0ABZ3BWY6_9GAMM|nr:DUF4177 domain-containing protein [Ignatzschineria larvae]
MAKYTYKMVQIAPMLSINEKDRKGNELAQYLERVVNEHAVEGWEFDRVDTFTEEIIAKPGCFGGKSEDLKKQRSSYVASFRKEIE